MKVRNVAVAAGAVVLLACGDPTTTDGRGYTKAPLEHPTVLIRSEDPGAVAGYGHPNRVVAEEIQLAAEEAPVADPTPTAPVQLPPGVTQAMVTEGRQLFSTGPCMACHGPTGGGTALAPALNDPTWLNVDGGYESLVQVINVGVAQPKQFAGMMPPKGGGAFSDDQVKQIAAYVYSISRPAAGAAAH